MAQIEALLYKLYNITMTGSKLRKDDYVKALEAELTRNVEKYNEYLLLLDMGSNANDDEGTNVVDAP